MAFYDGGDDKQLGGSTDPYGSALQAGASGSGTSGTTPLTGSSQGNIAGGSSNTASGKGGAAWTNIQSYLNANQNTTDGLHESAFNDASKQFETEYNNAKSYYNLESRRPVSENNVSGFSVDPYESSAAYNSLNDSVNAGRDSYMREFYDRTTGRNLTDGQFALQNQLDKKSNSNADYYENKIKESRDYYQGLTDAAYNAAQTPKSVYKESPQVQGGTVNVGLRTPGGGYESEFIKNYYKA